MWSTIRSTRLVLSIWGSITYLLFPVDIQAQEGYPSKDTISFNDTLFQIAFDSINCDLGEVEPMNIRMTKYFKYLGTDSLLITKSWTTDPHFICDYPRETLKPDSVYSYAVCFWFKDRAGPFKKSMGFHLSDGNVVRIQFSGFVRPKKSDLIHRIPSQYWN